MTEKKDGEKGRSGVAISSIREGVGGKKNSTWFWVLIGCANEKDKVGDRSQRRKRVVKKENTRLGARRLSQDARKRQGRLRQTRRSALGQRKGIGRGKKGKSIEEGRGGGRDQSRGRLGGRDSWRFRWEKRARKKDG